MGMSKDEPGSYQREQAARNAENWGGVVPR
jgi:stalled ribosome alternative rescue factor ArfA